MTDDPYPTEEYGDDYETDDEFEAAEREAAMDEDDDPHFAPMEAQEEFEGFGEWEFEED